jgi:hypothetical protein
MMTKRESQARFASDEFDGDEIEWDDESTGDYNDRKSDPRGLASSCWLARASVRVEFSRFARGQNEVVVAEHDSYVPAENVEPLEALVCFG